GMKWIAADKGKRRAGSQQQTGGQRQSVHFMGIITYSGSILSSTRTGPYITRIIAETPS
ncbi:hypothetical protein WA026_021612, partial [Henosepilachna vigintioctopunctata]